MKKKGFLILSLLSVALIGCSNFVEEEKPQPDPEPETPIVDEKPPKLSELNYYYELNELYNLDLINEDDLKSINYHLNNGFCYTKEDGRIEVEEDEIKSLKVLSNEEKDEIKQLYFYRLANDKNGLDRYLTSAEFTWDYLDFDFLGEYNGFYIALFHFLDSNVAAEQTIEVGSYTFSWRYGSEKIRAFNFEGIKKGKNFEPTEREHPDLFIENFSNILTLDYEIKIRENSLINYVTYDDLDTFKTKLKATTKNGEKIDIKFLNMDGEVVDEDYSLVAFSKYDTFTYIILSKDINSDLIFNNPTLIPFREFFDKEKEHFLLDNKTGKMFNISDEYDSSTKLYNSMEVEGCLYGIYVNDGSFKNNFKDTKIVLNSYWIENGELKIKEIFDLREYEISSYDFLADKDGNIMIDKYLILNDGTIIERDEVLIFDAYTGNYQLGMDGKIYDFSRDLCLKDGKFIESHDPNIYPENITSTQLYSLLNSNIKLKEIDNKTFVMTRNGLIDFYFYYFNNHLYGNVYVYENNNGIYTVKYLGDYINKNIVQTSLFNNQLYFISKNESNVNELFAYDFDSNSSIKLECEKEINGFISNGLVSCVKCQDNGNEEIYFSIDQNNKLVEVDGSLVDFEMLYFNYDL